MYEMSHRSSKSLRTIFKFVYLFVSLLFVSFTCCMLVAPAANALPASNDVVTNAVETAMPTDSNEADENQCEQELNANVPIPPPNFQTIVPDHIYRGGRPRSLNEFKWLVQQHKIKTVVNLQGADPDAFDLFEPGELEVVRKVQHQWAQLSGIANQNWINVPLDSAHDVTCSEAKKINQVLDIMRDPQYQPVYIHCEHGKDRTGLVSALYQVFYATPPMPPAAALQQMYTYGHSRLLFEMDDYFKLATTPPMSLHKLDTQDCP